MHCKQAGSAILKISLFEFNSNTSVMKICSDIHYLTKLQWDKYTWLNHKTDLCGNYVLLAWHGLCHIYALLSRIGFVANTRFFGCLVQTFTQTLRILLRFCADICTKNRPLGPLVHPSQMEYFLWRECIFVKNIRYIWPLFLHLNPHTDQYSE